MDFEQYKTFKPTDAQLKNVNAMLNQVVAWSGALKSLRNNRELAKRPLELLKLEWSFFVRESLFILNICLLIFPASPGNISVATLTVSSNFPPIYRRAERRFRRWVRNYCRMTKTLSHSYGHIDCKENEWDAVAEIRYLNFVRSL